MNTTSVAPAGASTGRWPLRLFGAALVLIALPLLAGGLYLITLGGSWYYLLAGLALALSGFFYVRRAPVAAWLLAATTIATVLWSLWEVGARFWELHFRRSAEGFAALDADIEEVAAFEIEHARDDGTGELFAGRVVVLNRRVVEPARRGQLVLDGGQLVLQLDEVRVRLQVRIGFRQCEQLAQRGSQHALGLAHFSRRMSALRRIPGSDHLLQRVLFVLGIALHGLDEVRDQVLALFQLHIDVSKGLVDPLPLHHKTVVNQDNEASDQYDDAKSNKHVCPSGKPYASTPNRHRRLTQGKPGTSGLHQGLTWPPGLATQYITIRN